METFHSKHVFKKSSFCETILFHIYNHFEHFTSRMSSSGSLRFYFPDSSHGLISSVYGAYTVSVAASFLLSFRFIHFAPQNHTNFILKVFYNTFWLFLWKKKEFMKIWCPKPWFPTRDFEKHKNEFSFLPLEMLGLVVDFMLKT